RARIVLSRARARCAASCRFLGRPKASLQMHQQQRNRRRRDSRNARRLSDGLGPITIELLLHFDRQAGYAAVIEISRQGERFELAPPCHLLALALDVALVLDLNLELLGDLRCGLRVGHQIGVAHTWLLEKLYGTPFFPSASAYHQTTQALLFVRDRIALAVECGPAPVIDQAKAAPRFRKAQVRVVLPKLKAVLGSAGKHPVGFGDA